MATPELLARLAALYPDLWYVPAAVAFTAANVPEALPPLFAFAAQGLDDAQQVRTPRPHHVPT